MNGCNKHVLCKGLELAKPIPPFKQDRVTDHCYTCMGTL